MHFKISCFYVHMYSDLNTLVIWRWWFQIGWIISFDEASTRSFLRTYPHTHCNITSLKNLKRKFNGLFKPIQIDENNFSKHQIYFKIFIEPFSAVALGIYNQIYNINLYLIFYFFCYDLWNNKIFQLSIVLEKFNGIQLFLWSYWLKFKSFPEEINFLFPWIEDDCSSEISRSSSAERWKVLLLILEMVSFTIIRIAHHWIKCRLIVTKAEYFTYIRLMCRKFQFNSLN